MAMLTVIIGALALVFLITEIIGFTADDSEKPQIQRFLIVVSVSSLLVFHAISYLYLTPRSVGDRFITAFVSRDSGTMMQLACRDTEILQTLEMNPSALLAGILLSAELKPYDVFFFPIANQMGFNLEVDNEFIPDVYRRVRLQLQARNLTVFCVENIDVQVLDE